MKDVEIAVLVISQLPPPHHGSTAMTEMLMKTLVSAGYTPHLTSRRFSRNVSDVGRVSMGKVLSGAGLAYRLLRDIKRTRPSVCIFFVTNRPASFMVDWALSELLRATKTRTINYIHTRGYSELANRNRIFHWMAQRLLTAAERTVCLGPSLTDDISNWVDERSILSIANTPPGTPTFEESGNVDRFRVLFLSNLIPEKGAQAFTELSLSLADEFPDFTFTLAGAAVDETQAQALRSKIAHAGKPNVQLWGPTSGPEKWKLLRESLVLVFPSQYRFEAQPLTIIEALAAGTPTVAYDVGGVVDIISQEMNGVLVPAGDLNLLTTTVRSFLQNTPDQVRLSAQARQSYDADFGAEVYLTKWRGLLRELL